MLWCVIHVQSHFSSLLYGFRGFIPFLCRMFCLRLSGYPGMLLLQIIVCSVHAFVPVLIPCCFQGCHGVRMPPAAAEKGGYTSVVRGGEVRAAVTQPFVGEGGVEQPRCSARLR